MRITTITFDFVIPSKYIAGTIQAPFTTTVTYEAVNGSFYRVTRVSIVMEVFHLLCGDMMELSFEMSEAARNNWESMQADETEPQDFTADLYRVLDNLNPRELGEALAQIKKVIQ